MAFNYGHCDSYFTMSNDDHRETARKEHARAYEEHQKKQTQLRMAEELSQLAKEEYGADILAHMEDQEVSFVGDGNQIFFTDGASAQNSP